MNYTSVPSKHTIFGPCTKQIHFETLPDPCSEECCMGGWDNQLATVDLNAWVLDKEKEIEERGWMVKKDEAFQDIPPYRIFGEEENNTSTIKGNSENPKKGWTILSLFKGGSKPREYKPDPKYGPTQLAVDHHGHGDKGVKLLKLGHDVTVVERFSSLRVTGLQIDLRGHGIEVMKRMGLEQAFRDKSAPEKGLQIVDRSGRRRAYFPANKDKSGKAKQNFTTDFEIMRGDLCRIMYDVTKDRIKYIFGTAVESFKEKENSVEVRFTDGKMDQFDLWVGADGQGSRTRKMMLGPDTADAFYPLNGVYIAYFTIPRPIQEGEEYIATSYIAPGRRGVMTRRQNPHAIQVYLGCTTDSERLKSSRPGDVKEEKSALTEIFQGAGWQTEDILKALPDVDDFYLERLGLVKLPSWFHGRVALVGDAAYCPSANTGMGTTSAIVGAYILAGEISRHCKRSNEEDADGGGHEDTQDGLTTALKAYEQKFKPFMDQVQKGISEDKGWSSISTPFGIAILNCFLGIASFFKMNIGKWFLREDAKGWDLPEYEEMLRD
ncbi:hypothetical protein G7Y89_g12695 [Cudoniella acicularis]|uniref:FAD-binding domain-containing protein n=1 Tax=Cudoniella acicularis TaxID=354080 RepID=A0A8H4R9X5_9HELO|nr:hypothetical protein G7Y89_g12695 [Cudoniella acicularis]